MKRKVVVTGGGGFVGAALCRALHQRGVSAVALGRNEYPALRADGIETVIADISDSPEQLATIFAGCNAVFHTAAYVKMWGDFADFQRINVTGTRNVIEGCRLAKVPHLIFTSSPSVIADGTDLRGVDESYPYPAHFEGFYPQTKAQAEQEVLAAHGTEFRTVALRPHLIFGPGDTNLVPTILLRAQQGRLLQIGAGNNRVDFSFIDDCVAAHLCAWDALAKDAAVGGKPYFISQGDPFPLWRFVDLVLRASGGKPITRSVPVGVALKIASALEWLSRSLPFLGEPRFTRFLVSEMATEHFFDISAAREKLGYRPSLTVLEGLQRTFPTANLAELR